jgi:GLPGLI family protein
MKLINISIVVVTLLTSLRVRSQNTIFLSQGRIEYEKKVNLYAQIDDDVDETWKELEKKTTPKFKTTYFDLRFNNNRTLYNPGRENTDNNRIWQQPADDNTVFTELDKNSSVSQKNIFDETFLVKDSTRKIKWKITDEKKTIAGFECRRANALIMDSVYIVAFYTEEIISRGGPESFSGLPGMILGVAIPHEHITWFATRVFAETIPNAVFVSPAKGKKVDNATLLSTLNGDLKGWGKWGRRYIKAAMF